MLNRRPVPVQCYWSTNLYNGSPGVNDWFPWFRNGIHESRVHPETLQTACHLVLPPCLCCSRLERKIGGKTGKDHRLRYEQFFENNSEWSAKVFLLKTKTVVSNSNYTNDRVYRKRGVWSHMIAHTWQYPTTPFPTLHHPEGSLSPFPRKWCGVVQNNFWVLPCSILATAKINAVLAGTRVLTKLNRQ